MPESTKSQTAAFSKRLTILYMAALGTIALLTIVGQLVVQQAILQLDGDSRIVNIAGRQRMLSQRLTRLTLELAHAKQQFLTDNSVQAKLVNHIRMDLETWTKNHEGLQHGSPTLQLPGANSPSVQKLFGELQEHFKTLKTTVEFALTQFEPHGPIDLDAIVRKDLNLHSDAFLAGMDNIVTRLEKEARDRVDRLRWIETALLFATIGVLICEGLFVFSPAVASLNRSLTKLQIASDELKKAKDIAEKANLAKTDFLARVSHELRTPLHAILGMLGLVEQSKLPHEQRTRIRLANEASASLLSLVDDLLDVASMEQGKVIVLHCEVVCLPGLITSTAEVMRPMAVQKGLRFELNLDSELPNLVTIDADKVRQVLTNLLQNAIRYTTRGYVRCNASVLSDANQSFLQLAVEDTGIGISQDDQARIFASFNRGLHVESSNAFGRRMGLGLAITQAMVKNLRGELSLTSEVGKGSRFLVNLPIAIGPSHEAKFASRPEIPQRATSKTAVENGDRPTALIVDDSTTNLLVMQSYLKQLGYRTMSVTSLNASLAKVRKHRFDLVLMDRHLPDGDGLDFTAMLNRPPNANGFFATKVFLVTAEVHLQPNSDERLKAFSGVLHKPISLSQLRAALKTIVLSENNLVNDQVVGAQFDQHAKNDEPNFERLKSKLAGSLIAMLPGDIASLRTMVSDCDYAGIEFISHRLIGSAGNAGLTEIACLAAVLNEAASERDMPRIENALSQLAKRLL